RAFADAGADVLYAPGLSTREQITSVVRAVAPKPVNLLASPALGSITVAELGTLGVKRISVGGLLARAAYSAALRAASDRGGNGSSVCRREPVPSGAYNGMFKWAAPPAAPPESGRLEVGGGGLAALGRDVERYALALAQRLHAGGLDGGDMDEYVLRA